VPRVVKHFPLDIPIHEGISMLPIYYCCLTLEIRRPLLPMDLFIRFALLLLLLCDCIPVSEA
jgi:hypothetical protein